MITTIHTKKSSYQNGHEYVLEKQKLFLRLSINNIINELKNNDINIDQKEIINEYKKTYDIDTIIDSYDQKYADQLDRLGEKGEMFDDDALVYLITKIIEKNFDIHSIPDLTYIASDILDLMHHETSDEKLLKQVKKLTKRLLKVKKYQDVSDLQNDFAQYSIDLEQFYTRAFSNISSIQDIYLLKSLYQLINDLYETYVLSLRYVLILCDIVETIVVYDQNDIDSMIENMINKDKTQTFYIYYKVLSGLKKANKKELVKQYLNKVKTLKPESEEQEDLLDVINKIFN